MYIFNKRLCVNIYMHFVVLFLVKLLDIKLINKVIRKIIILVFLFSVSWLVFLLFLLLSFRLVGLFVCLSRFCRKVKNNL